MSPDESLNVAALDAGVGWSVLWSDDQTPARRLDEVRFTLHGPRCSPSQSVMTVQTLHMFIIDSSCKSMEQLDLVAITGCSPTFPKNPRKSSTFYRDFIQQRQQVPRPIPKKPSPNRTCKRHNDLPQTERDAGISNGIVSVRQRFF